MAWIFLARDALDDVDCSDCSEAPDDEDDDASDSVPGRFPPSSTSFSRATAFWQSL